MSTHARFSPSKLSRIIACPGSLEDIKESKSSSYAEEGTMLHKVMEHKLRDLPWTGPTLTEEQLRAVEDALDYFTRLKSTMSSHNRYIIEERVYLTSYAPCLEDCHGTADVILFTDEELHIIDWKFGKGVPVYADNNDQLNAYLAGAAIEPKALSKLKRLVIHCVQPRLDNYSSFEHTPDSLSDWVYNRLVPGIEEALSDNPSFSPGTAQCRWCPKKMNCRARFDAVNKIAAEVFKTAPSLASGVSKEELADLYTRSAQLTKYISDIKEHMVLTLKSGETWPGYKLVSGRSKRVWAEPDPDECVERLLEFFDWSDLFEQKLISPPKAEKLIRGLKKDEKFQALIYKAEGNPTLVPESDKRKPLEFRTAAEIFSET